MDYWVLTFGLAIVSLVLVRLGFSIHHSMQRTKFHVQSDQLSLQLLEQRIDSAKRQFEFSSHGWNGYRKFEIVRKELEAADVCSFYLAPHDGKSLTPFRPGQYLTFRLDIPGREKPVIRCYSLSDCSNPGCYRVTVKRVLPPRDSPMLPPGLVSSFFHEQLEPGDIIDIQAPNGHFVLDPKGERPAVLIAGGVGITPILSMAKSIAASGSGREFIVFYGVRNGSDHAFKRELQELEEYPNCRLVVSYSGPTKDDEKRQGQQFQHQGWVNVELIKNYLDSTNYEFYICGPPPMMQAVSEQLAKWGVAASNIFTEAFGPATIKKVSASKTSKPGTGASAAGQSTCKVTFAKSGVSAQWDPVLENLLEFAEDQGVEIASGCRAGNCGTCVIAVKSGAVAYQTEPGVDPDEGSCLTCIAIPEGDLILDA
jgi:ferredoxin-NADP reductase